MRRLVDSISNSISKAMTPSTILSFVVDGHGRGRTGPSRDSTGVDGPRWDPSASAPDQPGRPVSTCIHDQSSDCVGRLSRTCAELQWAGGCVGGAEAGVGRGRWGSVGEADSMGNWLNCAPSYHSSPSPPSSHGQHASLVNERPVGPVRTTGLGDHYVRFGQPVRSRQDGKERG